MGRAQKALEMLGRHGVRLEPFTSTLQGDIEILFADLVPPIGTRADAAPELVAFVELGADADLEKALAIARQQPVSTVLLFDWLHPRTASALFKSNTQYIDSAGNAFIHLPGTYIYISGNTNVQKRMKAPRKHSTSPFIGLRLQVVLALLEGYRPDSIRDLAAASGVSVGTAAGTLAGLSNLGYAEGLEIDESKRGYLLDTWARGYLGTPRFRNVIASYYIDPDQLGNGDLEGLFVSGELAASDLVRPTSAVFFAEEWSPRQAAMNRWTAKTNPNIHIKRKFWNHATDPRSPENFAPRLVTYAELLSSSSPRTQEVAEEYRSVHIGF